MVSKKIIMSGLMIASLSLTGCSGLQDAINNKIASTAKEVSDGVNSEVSKATDALKTEGEKIQSDFGVAADQLKKEFGVMTTYTNTEFGFSLQFPQSWGKVTAKPVVEKKMTNIKAKFIEIVSEDKKKSYTVIAVDNNAGEEDGLERSIILGKTAKYTLFGEHDGTGFEGGTDTEIKAINSTFKML